MFFKCSRLVVTSFISLSILFSVVSPAVAVKGAEGESPEGKAKKANLALKSAKETCK